MQYVLTPLPDTISVRSIATAFFFEFACDYRSREDIHPFWELVYIDRGRAVAQEDGKEYLLEPGQTIFHKPDIPHGIRSDGVPTCGFIISFDTNSPDMSFFEHRICRVPEEGKQLIAQILRAAADTFDQQVHPLIRLSNAPKGGEQRIRCNLELLLLTLLDNVEPLAISPSAPAADNRLVEEIIQWLKDHLYEKITADDLCKAFHYHKSRLYEIFRESTGTTPLNFYNRMKIEEAKQRILEKRESFDQIAEALNFDTPLYFSRVFKKFTGMPPSAYRKSVIRYSNINFRSVYRGETDENRR